MRKHSARPDKMVYTLRHLNHAASVRQWKKPVRATPSRRKLAGM